MERYKGCGSVCLNCGDVLWVACKLITDSLYLLCVLAHSWVCVCVCVWVCVCVCVGVCVCGCVGGCWPVDNFF